MDQCVCEPGMPGCPGREALVDFDLGRLAHDQFEEVAAHVSSCLQCEEVLYNLNAAPIHDALVSRLRESLQQARPCETVDYNWIDSLAKTFIISPRIWRRGTAHADGECFDLTYSIEREFGSYKLLGQIGQGGMGVVYRARQVSLARPVAIKMILAGRHASAQTVARFIREGKAVARLQHPAVVQVFELGEYKGLPFYSMELVDGGSLEQTLAKGPLELRLAAQLVRTLAETAQFAHQQGIIHRDLKPANILFTLDGRPKITDFGLAKLLERDPGEETSSLTETGTILGSANYMAPEQLSGRSADITPATDVYALGAILYECLTGRPPFTAATKLEILDLVRNASPVRPYRLRSDVPSWLETICWKCLEKSPGRRYETAQALADDLDLWLRNERPKGLPNPLTSFIRRTSRHVAAIVVAVAIVSIGIVLYPNNPEHVLQRNRGELVLGRPVTLVGETGKPGWFRCMAGASRSNSVLSDDNTFTIHAWTLSLLELMPEARCQSYRLTAQVRHENSDAPGEVGIYFARVSHNVDRRQVQAFLQLTFNGVRGDAEMRKRLPPNFKMPGPPRLNTIALLPHLYSDEAIRPNVNLTLRGATGPGFQPLGEYNGCWHQLELTVTPTLVTALFNGAAFSMPIESLREKSLAELTRISADAAPVPLTFRPQIDVHGGVGLYVSRGTASFRSVTVTPL